ncbi:MAG: hypothetical protein ACLFQX_07390 [Candidatus Kapaibacterium sp.]
MKLDWKKSAKSFALILSIVVLGAGCIVVKHPDKPDVAPTVNLSPKPEIDMSDNLVRSERGDMIAFLPKGWFFIDVDMDVSSDVFAVAVNPDYTMGVVFSYIKSNDRTEQIVGKEGLLGLARLTFARHEQKTAGGVKLAGKYSEIEMGKNKFAQFKFAANPGDMATRAAVFRSSIGNYYEFALSPMDIKGEKIPTDEEFDRIFRSVLTTIQY